MKDWKTTLPETLRGLGAVWIPAVLPGSMTGGTLCYRGRVMLVLLRDQPFTKKTHTPFENKLIEVAGHAVHFALDESDVLALIGIEG